MSEWDAKQYLKFKMQRTQSAIDLVKRISYVNAKEILDIGCGPGNSTSVLKDEFKNAHVLGVDNSEAMISKAKSTYSNIDFKICDVTEELNSSYYGYDIIFANACLQWMPNHKELIPFLFKKLNKNGVFAVQIPINGAEKLFRIMADIISEPKWNFEDIKLETNTALAPEQYFDILASITDKFDIWETVYYHRMPSCDAMVEWIKGARLRPYINALDKDYADKLEFEIIKAAQKEYIAQDNGEFIFKFRRLFFTAFKL